MNIFENFKMAMDSIKSNKMRSFLTMLGIIIGISSVITIISLGSGGKNSILDQFEKMGANNINITVDTTNANSNDYITLKDVESIKTKVDTIKYVIPTNQQRGKVFSDVKSKTASITGTTENYLEVNNTNILYGRFFNSDEVLNSRAVAVIDENTAKDLFGYSDVVGKNIKLSSDSITKTINIVGVSESINMGPQKDVAFITTPITFFKIIYPMADKISSITFTATSKDDSDIASRVAINILESRHNNEGRDIYKTQNIMEKLTQVNNILGIFTTFIAAVASISLLVGGIGVMNIMLVSVTERTREIGIRKAIGATTRTILIQFLTESSIVSLIGGIIGLILGIVASQIIGILVGVAPAISIIAILGVILFSSAIGIFFGIYPAKKAANLDPIDALRYE
ncbi:putative ABC transport system permease protein [Clostridium cavendishii DSM 21758]|uniref:Putative ABC transport system permease protein n=1 Tax=Clostridium cavendishii DSM 21758 TaxID=1121302 RepID=A0A1M6I3U9_9CLOT|nr:ABC transporter permease [Clostridium cavendishii]SHJ29118.1 putative ABC transport system permease protein [Clostridium cavendishii DSM 21758]